MASIPPEYPVALEVAKRYAEIWLVSMSGLVYLFSIPTSIMAVRLWSIWKREKRPPTDYFLAIPLMSCMGSIAALQDILKIFLHTGLTKGSATLIPKLLPDTCSAMLEDSGSWPCTRDRISGYFDAVSGPQGWRHLGDPGLADIASWVGSLAVVAPLCIAAGVFIQYFLYTWPRDWAHQKRHQRLQKGMDVEDWSNFLTFRGLWSCMLWAAAIIWRLFTAANRVQVLVEFVIFIQFFCVYVECTKVAEESDWHA